jgi:membrane protein implicated in regulation of membrane protease activity
MIIPLLWFVLTALLAMGFCIWTAPWTGLALVIAVLGVTAVLGGEELVRRVRQDRQRVRRTQKEVVHHAHAR